ncbi:39S ribosomal protein L53, mitochondrial-like [Mizuhopecten yessoensis]|uniref:39S ribosomal protein L53, mitochondrial-like n=1 Tax=Mizuhopecten yessoensis TaxID=6573 RepID=UPI000B45C233|nr:39S ribosomal protein L53, mitochondrial-like [Mizuhopecten yessoensis]
MAHNRAISGILKNFQIRPIKKMIFKFDPYSSDVRAIREVLYALHSDKILSTNLNCVPKVDIMSDQSEPEMKVDFTDGQKVLFKTKNLTTLDVLLKLHGMCTEKDPKKLETSTIDTKSSRKKVSKK